MHRSCCYSRLETKYIQCIILLWELEKALEKPNQRRVGRSGVGRWSPRLDNLMILDSADLYLDTRCSPRLKLTQKAKDFPKLWHFLNVSYQISFKILLTKTAFCSWMLMESLEPTTPLSISILTALYLSFWYSLFSNVVWSSVSLFHRFIDCTCARENAFFV